MRKYLSMVLFAILAMPVLVALAQETPTPQPTTTADLSPIKNYLLEKVAALKTSTQDLKAAATDYYSLAETVQFDYAYLWSSRKADTDTALNTVRAAWITASPLYEKMEGIVGGVPTLSEFDLILDAGASGEEDPQGGVPFDLTLRDGRVLKRPGNLFGVLEGSLWGTRTDYSSGVWADLNDNRKQDFGETLPDANVVLAAAEAMDSYTGDLQKAAQAWEPNEEDAFTALVVMLPTMNDFFASWRDSRFVSGNAAKRTDFAVISRLSDIRDNLDCLIVIYEGVSPLVAGVDPAQDKEIHQGLVDLEAYVTGLYTQEQKGRVFKPEEADLFGNEAQDRAQAIAGQLTQVAALLGVTLPE